jgi:hypothetical protein
MMPDFSKYALSGAAAVFVALIWMTPRADASVAAEGAAPAQTARACEITGLVAQLDNVQSSPWSDGAPSAFGENEVRIAVEIEQRLPHGQTPPDACQLTPAGDASAMAVYKLCSPTTVRPGDHIRATEGAAPIKGFSCLFDVTVIPKG